MNNSIVKILSVVIVSASVSSCGLYSKYQRPTDISKSVEGLYDYTTISTDTTNMATMSWRELFTDTKLQALIEQGLAQNTNLNVAKLNVEQATIALKTARLAFLPSVSLGADGKVYEYRDATYKTYDLAASASWEVDIFGKIRNSKEQNKAALEQSEAYYQAVQTELISTIANSYYSLLMLDEQLDISRRTEKNWDDNLRVMEALKSAGRINQTAVLQTASNKVALSRNIIAIEKQIKDMESSLSIILGVSPNSIERGKFSSLSLPSEVSVGVPMQLLNNRPDVRVAEANLSQMFYATNVARSSLYPSITLSGGAGYTNSMGTITNPGDMLYELLGSLTQPLFNRGTLRAQLKISESQQQQALLNFNQALLDAGDEVNRALIQLTSAKESLLYDKEQLEILERAVVGTKLLMRHGSANYLEVLTAQYTLLQTELTNTSNKFSEVQGVISLYRALGGGR